MRVPRKNQRQHELIEARRCRLGQDDGQPLIGEDQRDRLRPGRFKLGGEWTQLKPQWTIERKIQASATERLQAFDIQTHGGLGETTIEVELGAETWRHWQRLAATPCDTGILLHCSRRAVDAGHHQHQLPKVARINSHRRGVPQAHYRLDATVNDLQHSVNAAIASLNLHLVRTVDAAYGVDSLRKIRGTQCALLQSY